MASADTVSFERADADPVSDRYSRQRLIHAWDQQKLRNARVLVAGAGALGNEVLKNLALLGIGRIVVIDFDCIEISNLSRSVLFSEDDIGKPKASTAASALRRLNPDVCVEAIDGDLETDLGLGEIRECNVALGCLDSIYARWIFNRVCWRAGRPWINAGLSATVGEVSLHVPGVGACYECGMTQQMWRQIHERRSCMMRPAAQVARVMPATAVTASITAALQVNEAVRWIHGDPRLQPGEMLLCELETYSLSSVVTSMKHDCLAHDTYTPSIFLAADTDMRVGELLNRVPGGTSLQLDFDVVRSFVCAQCGEEPIGRRLSRVLAEQFVCKCCHAQRVPNLTHEISLSDPLADSTLRELGVPPRSILRVKTGCGTCHVELTYPNRAGGPDGYCHH
jgi:adenylyltransferase/sulfurtransferase